MNSSTNCRLFDWPRFVGLVTTFVWASIPAATASAQSDATIKVPYRNQEYIGKPLAWDGKELMLLRRDGKINFLPVKSEKDYQSVSSHFKPFSPEVLRKKLQQEFGSKYQVSITRNFVVVHPTGDYQTWAMPFEQLYARFTAYFSGRHFTLKEPEFPMVAVVLRTRREFDRFLNEYHSYDGKILGYYNPLSNRIITYDQSGGATKSPDWLFNTSTIIHEATHQTAFNTGIHSRYAPVPRWISEGLAMLFEAPGVNNSMEYTRLEDRVNQERLDQLRLLYQRNLVTGALAELITDDNLFRTSPSRAYAVSWGVTFYLSEKMPREYYRFLADDAARRDFSGYSGTERAAAFAKAFGAKMPELEARMKQFIDELDRLPKR